MTQLHAHGMNASRNTSYKLERACQQKPADTMTSTCSKNSKPFHNAEKVYATRHVSLTSPGMTITRFVYTNNSCPQVVRRPGMAEARRWNCGCFYSSFIARCTGVSPQHNSRDQAEHGDIDIDYQTTINNTLVRKSGQPKPE